MTLNTEDIKKYKSLYLQTARNYIENMQEYISHLLKHEQTKNSIKQVHLAAHSLKSQSQLMGFNDIAKISEIIEHIFNQDNKENPHVAHHTLIRIQSDLTRLLDSMNHIEAHDTEIDIKDRINDLESHK